ncbi:MAG: uroporphyrinogen-III synthase [Rhodothermales bacterium]
MESRPLVYLLRTPDEGSDVRDRFENALDGEGFRAVSIPVIAYENAGEEALRQALLRPEGYGGLVLTSPRAAQRLVETLARYRIDPMPWIARPAFAVGPATARLLAAAGFAPVGEESGEASRLARQVVRRETAHPWLFLCGNRRRDALPGQLVAAGVPFEECLVYRTVDLEPDWRAYAVPTWMAFFSPSGVLHAAPALPDTWRAVRAAAIGPTTAEALKTAGWMPEAIAAAPTPAALATAIKAAG